MERLPGRRGTVQDVCAEVEKLGVPLDRSFQPGTKSRSRWQHSVANALSWHPEFEMEVRQ